ncbi:MAG TPA: ribonuclease HII [Candidatus Limnocylindrales bacterium]
MASMVPSLRFERPLWREGLARIAGVDEVGVAPTCGAVVAAAVIMSPHCRRIPGVRDSKTLSALQRERLAPIIRRRAIAVGIGAASVAEIDRLNIYHATHLAMRRAIGRLGGHEHVLVDGNRIAGFEEAVGPYTAIIDGDAKCYTIACASVVAKVVRDRMMDRLAARYPEYGWDRNAGYATREHRAAIRRFGLTPFHRRSFQALQRTLAGEQTSLGLFGGAAVVELADDFDGGSDDDLDALRATPLDGSVLDGAAFDELALAGAERLAP